MAWRAADLQPSRCQVEMQGRIMGFVPEQAGGWTRARKLGDESIPSRGSHRRGLLRQRGKGCDAGQSVHAGSTASATVALQTRPRDGQQDESRSGCAGGGMVSQSIVGASDTTAAAAAAVRWWMRRGGVGGVDQSVLLPAERGKSPDEMGRLGAEGQADCFEQISDGRRR